MNLYSKPEKNTYKTPFNKISSLFALERATKLPKIELYSIVSTKFFSIGLDNTQKKLKQCHLESDSSANCNNVSLIHVKKSLEKSTLAHLESLVFTVLSYILPNSNSDNTCAGQFELTGLK